MHKCVRAHIIPDTLSTMATRRKLAAGAWGALLRVHAVVVPELDRTLQHEAGLSLAWYDVLLELGLATGGKLRMSDLAERVTLSRTRVSRIVDELTAAGFVQRAGHPDDRRSSLAVITSPGRAAFRRAAPIYLAAIEERFADGLSAAQLDDLGELLRTVLARRTGTRALVT
jgi:DNA-binding MarR family transcriptional regulator